MQSVIQIEQAIAELNEADRSYLAKKILSSFDQPEQLTQQEKDLLDCRSSQMKSGKTPSISLSELKKRMGAA